MSEKKRAKIVLKILNKTYPHAPIPLKHRNIFTLLVSVLLSAQCTDVNVNNVTRNIYPKYNQPKHFVELGQKKIENLIKSIGIFRIKSRSIYNLSKTLVNKYKGKVPRSFEELEELPGVGHKTASVVMAQGFGVLNSGLIPLNFLWIGFIKLIFPNAKVINCTRDPLNNCFSIYKLLFEGNLYWSYSLADVANYYNLYRDLMKFWKEKYPEFICDAPYEEIVNNPQKSIKEITEFCNLKWSDDFLKFYNNKKPIRTNSSNQARQPLYKSSLNISEKYGEHLDEISKILDN